MHLFRKVVDDATDKLICLVHIGVGTCFNDLKSSGEEPNFDQVWPINSRHHGIRAHHALNDFLGLRDPLKLRIAVLHLLLFKYVTNLAFI